MGALCELIDANVRILGLLKKQFITHEESNSSYYKRQNPSVLRSLEAENSVLQEMLGALETTLKSQESALCKTLDDVKQVRTRVSTSCCFINRLPNEILTEILCKASRYDGSIYNKFDLNVNFAPHFSLRLSHVCRRWRAVAISSPSLWTEIKLCPGSYQILLQGEFWQSLSTYVRDAPMNISITDSEICTELVLARGYHWDDEMSYSDVVVKCYPDGAISHMQSYDLRTFKTINSITLDFHFEPDLVSLLNSEYQNLDCRCHTLRVAPTYRSRGVDILEVDLSVLLYHFDAEVVECIKTRILVPSEGSYGRGVTEIRFTEVKAVPLDQLLMAFPEITALCCTDCNLEWQRTDITVHAKLRRLELERSTGSMQCRWMNYLQCPALEELHASEWANEGAFINFIARSPRIRTLTLSGRDEKSLWGLAGRITRINHAVHDWRLYRQMKVPPPPPKWYPIPPDYSSESSLRLVFRRGSLALDLEPSQFDIVGGRNIVESPSGTSLPLS
ncbi:SubName: Full=Uncharacterized protein {ECO:0000313/EMBL:CCA71768.1} [Serendipita indica DSM 11827]|nr:SubName: Full=Uncharacterized protein {ECO:0000313/EMBL:CCA71768.1} [Serendipita indica DSM 11827]